MNSRFAYVLGMAILMLGTDLALAQEQFTLTPSLAVSETYDDNIYLVPKNQGRRFDYITSISPGILFDMQSLRRDLQLSYVPSIVRYMKNEVNDTVRHQARVTYREELAEHLRFDFTDDYIKSEDPLDITPFISGIRRTRNPYQRNSGEARGTYSFGPENTVTAGYRNSLLINDDPTLDDGTIHEPFTNLAYWFDKIHGMEFTYRYMIGTFSREAGPTAQPDFTGHNPGLRYNHRFSPQTSGYASYNYATRDFEQQDVNVLFSQDYDIHSFMVGVDKQFNPQTNVTAGVGYFIEKTDQFNVDDESGFAYNAYLNRTFQRGRFTVGGVGGWDEQFLQAENRGFVKFWSTEGSGEYFFSERLTGYGGALYREDEYQNGQKEQNFRGGAGIRWPFHRYVSLLFDYSYAKRSSDIPLNDYSDNRFMVVLTGTKSFKPYKL